MFIAALKKTRRFIPTSSVLLSSSSALLLSSSSGEPSIQYLPSSLSFLHHPYAAVSARVITQFAYVRESTLHKQPARTRSQDMCTPSLGVNDTSMLQELRIQIGLLRIENALLAKNKHLEEHNRSLTQQLAAKTIEKNAAKLEVRDLKDKVERFREALRSSCTKQKSLEELLNDLVKVVGLRDDTDGAADAAPSPSKAISQGHEGAQSDKNFHLKVHHSKKPVIMDDKRGVVFEATETHFQARNKKRREQYAADVEETGRRNKARREDYANNQCILKENMRPPHGVSPTASRSSSD